MWILHFLTNQPELGWSGSDCCGVIVGIQYDCFQLEELWEIEEEGDN